MCDTFNNANDLTEKIVCDVPVNGNVFLGATVWQRMSITHNFYVVNICTRLPNANSFQEKVVCDCSLIQDGLFLKTVFVA